MKLKKISFSIVLIALFLIPYTSWTRTSNGMLLPGEKETLVLIKTSLGDIKVKLYNETPVHRDNFIKLIKQGYYDSLLFHRVINQFMIQGGDPDSKNAAPGKALGMGEPGYTLPAEIIPGLYHKKGALAAAREPDRVNPQKRSSGSQFYLVQGKVFTPKELETLEARINQSAKYKIIQDFITNPANISYRNQLDSLQKAQDSAGMSKIFQEIEALNQTEIDKVSNFHFTEKQIEIYTTIGGTPHLDGDYTVFGEIIEGFEVLDNIAAVETDGNNRPLQDVLMFISILK